MFTQRLGRGLRKADDKSYLTVIDLIGQQHREFRFDRRLGAIVDRRRGPLRQQLEAGFRFLPSGCSVDLDRQSNEIVLRNLQDVARLSQWQLDASFQELWSHASVRYIESAATDVLLVTLKKAERDYSPTTMYRDYAISPTLFHWESQSTQGASSPAIRRYEEHARLEHPIALFVRDRRTLENGIVSPYVFLGPAQFVSSTGDRPVAFTWRLETPMPEELFEVARTVGAA